MIDRKLKYDTFNEFCERAYELREAYSIGKDTPPFLMDLYRAYVYSHNFHERYGEAVNDKCWEWLLSKYYDKMNINDLYSMQGRIGKKK